MAFKGVRYRVIKALREGTYQHAARGSIEDKNALMTGDISVGEYENLVFGK